MFRGPGEWQKICLAGVEGGVVERNVLDAFIDVGRKQRKAYLNVSGLVNDQHISWTEKGFSLEVGDKVTIKIVEADAADEPIRRHPQKKE